MEIGLEVFVNFNMQEITRLSSIYIELVWSNDNVCDLCPLNKHIIVAKVFVHISRDVLSEQAISLIQSKTGFTSKVTV